MKKISLLDCVQIYVFTTAANLMAGLCLLIASGCHSPAIQTGGSINVVQLAGKSQPAQSASTHTATNATSDAAQARQLVTQAIAQAGLLPNVVNIAREGGSATSTRDASPVTAKGSNTDTTTQTLSAAVSRLKWFIIGGVAVGILVALGFVFHKALGGILKAAFIAAKLSV